MTISKERLAEIAAIREEDIDTSEIPELDERFFAKAKLRLPSGKTLKPVTLRVDEDVLDWFASNEDNHLAQMNAVLRAYMLSRQSDR